MKAFEVQQMLQLFGTFEVIVDYFRLDNQTGVAVSQMRNGQRMWSHAVRAEGKPSTEIIGDALINIGQWMLLNQEKISGWTK